jgi:hypothetical protein
MIGEPFDDYGISYHIVITISYTFDIDYSLFVSLLTGCVFRVSAPHCFWAPGIGSRFCGPIPSLTVLDSSLPQASREKAAAALLGSKGISLSRKIVLPYPWPMVDNNPLT